MIFFFFSISTYLAYPNVQMMLILYFYISLFNGSLISIDVACAGGLDNNYADSMTSVRRSQLILHSYHICFLPV